MTYVLQGLAFILLFPSTFWSAGYMVIALTYDRGWHKLASAVLFLAVIMGWITWFEWVT